MVREEPDVLRQAIAALLGVLAVVIITTVLVYVGGHPRRHPTAALIVSFGVPILAIVALLVTRTRHRAAR